MMCIRCHNTQNPSSWEVTEVKHDKTNGLYKQLASTNHYLNAKCNF